jgi:dienelactone hydrolase
MAAFSQGTPEEDGHVGRDGTLRGFLRLPPGARRAPFALLLHGCAGLAGNTAFGLRDWADWLQARGVGALVLDSFGPRGVRRTCGPSDGHWAHRRVDDLFSAITYLHDRGLVPEGHVFALGQSNGGRTVMNAAAVSEYDRSARLAGAFALYPYCGDDARTEFVRPLAIFTPERDEHNRPEECQRLSRGGRRFASPTVVRLQGATHSYDVRAPLREDRGNVMEFSESGLSRTREAVSAFLDRLGRPAAPEPADRY